MSLRSPPQRGLRSSDRRRSGPPVSADRNAACSRALQTGCRPGRGRRSTSSVPLPKSAAVRKAFCPVPNVKTTAGRPARAAGPPIAARIISGVLPAGRAPGSPVGRRQTPSDRATAPRQRRPAGRSADNRSSCRERLARSLPAPPLSGRRGHRQAPVCHRWPAVRRRRSRRSLCAHGLVQWPNPAVRPGHEIRERCRLQDQEHRGCEHGALARDPGPATSHRGLPLHQCRGGAHPGTMAKGASQRYFIPAHHH